MFETLVTNRRTDVMDQNPKTAADGGTIRSRKGLPESEEAHRLKKGKKRVVVFVGFIVLCVCG